MKPRTLLATSCVGIALAFAIPLAFAQGQGAPAASAQTRTIEPQEFLRLAYSSASLQGQIAQLAASRDTRPEVKSFAAAATEFRTGLLKRLEAFAGEQKLSLPNVKEFQHQVIVENLEPLDYLALSRRYAEVQMQALDQEVTIYQAAGRSPDQGVKSFADQVLPELQQQQAEARKMFDTVKR